MIGHPALLMPSAVVWSASANDAPSDVIHAAAGTSVLIAVIVAAYCAIQVRSRRWSHVDASVPRERSQLNLFLSTLLFGSAALLWMDGQPRSVVAGLLLGGAVVVAAHLVRRRHKISLHAAFAVFAVALLWPHAVAVGIGLVLAAGVSWSRLALERHTPREVALGLLLGGLAGLGFQLFAVQRSFA